MNLRDLQYLVAVADLKHFGKAAEKCFVSQPALSQQLQKLEAYLNIKLFERTNKSVIVTSIGEQIVEKARQLLQDAEAIKTLAETSQNPLAGEFRLGAFPTLAPYLFPSIIPKIIKKLPDLKLLLTEEKTDALINKLIHGELDAAFIALPITNDKLDYIELFSDPFMLAVNKHHKLVDKKSITEADIQNQELLLLEDGHCLRNQALDVCSLMGSSEHADFKATSLETLRQMVAAGTGITLIPKIAAQKTKNIVYIPFEKPEPKRNIALVFRKTTNRLGCIETIAKIIH